MPPTTSIPRFETDGFDFIPGKYIYLEGAGPGLSNALFRSKIRPRSSEKSVLTFMISSQNGGDLAPSAEGPGRAGRALCVRLDTLPLKVSVRDVEGKRGHPGSGFRRSPRAGAGTEGPPAGTPGHPRGPGALLPACVATFVGGPGLVPKSPMRPLSAVHWASAAWSLARQAAQARTRARTAASRNRRHGPREAPAGPGWPRACQGVARDASRLPYGQIGVDVEGGPPLYVIPPRPEPRPLRNQWKMKVF